MTFCFKPSLDPATAAASLRQLVACRMDPLPFQQPIKRLERMFAAYLAHASPPWAASGLALGSEEHYQSELWLPLSTITPIFHRFFRSALKYPPVYSSTPFATARSWAGIVAALPPAVSSCSPAALLEQLLEQHELRIAFLFACFMPQRFYGSGADRYPGQSGFIRDRLGGFKGKLRCLDAACGDGLGCYNLACLLLEQGRSPEMFRIEGWTLDPLECWAAAHGIFPHDPQKSAAYGEQISRLFAGGADASLAFRQVDLLDSRCEGARFDLIVCNGLLGGPIIHGRDALDVIVARLASLLVPGGMLLAADNFHAGWKKKCPPEELRALFARNGLECFTAGEGIGGRRSG